MRIVADSIGKKYNTNWIFRDISIELGDSECLAIVGPNGSGKSTLLQILINTLTPSRGEVSYYHTGEKVEPETILDKINFSSPYMDLIEEYSLIEHLRFNAKFKKNLVPFDEIIEAMGYPNARNKLVSEFSSGMKQRLKLALVFFYEGEILALDEPTSNLDSKGIDWYQSLIENHQNRNILIASNQGYEYEFCQKKVELAP